MNPLNPPAAVVYVGLDLAKASRQLDLQGRAHTLPNTPAGHDQLLTLLRPLPGAHVVCEATGGYERAGVAALQAAALPVSVVKSATARWPKVSAPSTTRSTPAS